MSHFVEGRFSRGELLLWVGSHSALLTLPFPLISLSDDPSRYAVVLFSAPALLGGLETILLWRRVRWIGWWLPLTLLGLPLAFVLGLFWFWLFAIGIGIGLAQMPLIWLAGWRWPGLWVLASGGGWLAGLVAAILVLNATPALGQHGAAVMYGLAGAGHAIATGLYLMIGKKPTPLLVTA